MPHHIDLESIAAIATLVADLSPQWVFHLAAYGAYPSQNTFARALATNVLATAGLVEAVLNQGVESFVVAGSSSEYGAKDHAPDEGEGLDPASYYASTKAAATVLCRQFAASVAANLVILRLYSIYGPYEDPLRLIPAIIAESWKGRLPPLVNAESAHDFVFIDDVVDAFYLCAARTNHAPGAIYNVSTGVQLSLQEVVDISREVLHVAEEPDWGSMPSRTWDTGIWCGNSSALTASTGWQARHSFRSGFMKTVDWFADPLIRSHYIAAREDARR